MSNSTLDSASLPTTYCVVGAGPLGLIAARAFRRYGIDVELIERNTRVGGIWDIENPGSPMYETCHFITSKEYGGFIGYPMPSAYPDYPSWRQVHEYIENMAVDYGLDQLITFGTEVTDARPVETEAGTYWKVTLDSGEVRDYRGVIYAGGQQWHPFIPDVPGLESFTGRAIHSKDYRSISEFEGKRVLVIGAGNSGVDIAVDAANHAEKAFLSTRRAYHFFPKQIFGIPTPDLLNGKVPLPELPMLGALDPQQQLDLVLATVGDLSRYGLPVPEHPVGSTQAIVSNLVLHCFAHGLLTSKSDVRRISGSTVEFVDGSVEDVDVIVMATGYDIEIPWLADGVVPFVDGHPVFHLGTFVDGASGLYGIGIIHPSAADAWAIFDQLFQLAAADANAVLTGENADNIRRIRDEYRPDLKADFPFLDVRRNANQADLMMLRNVLGELAETYGVVIPSQSDTEFYAEQLVRPVDSAKSA
ncbi:NAD(P)/FAD-dependent oxidoreductase [Rhodococcus sp. ABRD24]|uniref:flavin-containing monooxygenase n=1 Tax=Rhodococcus sp. ABRD24 TaxID=2507582 RepID=UPI00103F13C9|nr:NAD(P)/FAD-dependent oxidoreductase [Rhodococcus sp. ABRD24]QBJ98075.1 NAD(P)/FAD-dependent oxidoreductase [Rhodococcus sp. ABRD24]